MRTFPHLIHADNALLVFATAAATAALQVMFGIVGTALAVMLFVALGNPASGGRCPPSS